MISFRHTRLPLPLASVWNNLPPLADELIKGVLRKGHKMLLAGPSKAGKSSALIEIMPSEREHFDLEWLANAAFWTKARQLSDRGWEAASSRNSHHKRQQSHVVAVGRSASCIGNGLSTGGHYGFCYTRAAARKGTSKIFRTKRDSIHASENGFEDKRDKDKEYGGQGTFERVV